jgi:YidC/Oxa1 family membrane protein insertase
LRLEHELLRSFDIGSGTTRTVLFRKIECREFVMTIPDLQNMWLKRSVHPVHYTYVFHSTNSTHTSYRKGAFDHYDTIMCVGPYHVEEIRRTEEHYGLKPKELVEAGSVKLDTVMRQFADLTRRAEPNDPPEVLVAPTWGQGSMIEMPIGEQVLRTLVDAGFSTVLRLHPMTVRHHPELPARLQAAFSDQPLFRLEQDMSATESWLRSDLMVSDWSGAATEYAFALEKPVVFVDTPQKIRNPEWRAIGLPAFEDGIRREIGTVLAPDDHGRLSAVVDESLQVSATQAGARDRSEWIFNRGHAASTIASRIHARTD